MAAPPDKLCPVCGRRFQWRKQWARDWEQVKFCSARCRSTRLDDTDRAMEDCLRRLLRASAGKPVPLDALGAQLAADPDSERARNAARRLVAAGEAVLVRQGRVVAPETARGKLWLRRV